MTERQVLDIIEQEWRRRRLPVFDRAMSDALRAAARRIVREAEADQRAAARAASMVGFSVTRGRTRL